MPARHCDNPCHHNPHAAAHRVVCTVAFNPTTDHDAHWHCVCVQAVPHRPPIKGGTEGQTRNLTPYCTPGLKQHPHVQRLGNIPKLINPPPPHAMSGNLAKRARNVHLPHLLRQRHLGALPTALLGKQLRKPLSDNRRSPACARCAGQNSCHWAGLASARVAPTPPPTQATCALQSASKLLCSGRRTAPLQRPGVREPSASAARGCSSERAKTGTPRRARPPRCGSSRRPAAERADA